MQLKIFIYLIMYHRKTLLWLQVENSNLRTRFNSPIKLVQNGHLCSKISIIHFIALKIRFGVILLLQNLSHHLDCSLPLSYHGNLKIRLTLSLNRSFKAKKMLARNISPIQIDTNSGRTCFSIK